MSDIISRWPVLLRLAVGADELDADRRLTPEGAERVFGEARRFYFELCESIADLTIEPGECTVRPGTATVGSGAVVVSTGVVEIYPDAFIMDARIRSDDGPGIVADVSCTLRVDGELPKACVDEFIALAHAAQHMN